MAVYYGIDGTNKGKIEMLSRHQVEEYITNINNSLKQMKAETTSETDSINEIITSIKASIQTLEDKVSNLEAKVDALESKT